MLYQPPVSPLTLAMTENYEICCHKMSDFKAKMHQFVCPLGLRPRPGVYSVHFVYLYVLCNWPLAPCYKIVPRPMYTHDVGLHDIVYIHARFPCSRYAVIVSFIYTEVMKKLVCVHL